MQVKEKKIPIIFVATIIFLICFLLLAAFRSSFYELNLRVNIWAASINNGSFTIVAKEISLIFDTTILAIISIIVAVFLFVRNGKRFGLLLLCAMAGDALLVSFFKAILMSQRPANEILLETGYSFPSGHVTGCVVFFGILVYISLNNWHSLGAKIVTYGLYLEVTLIVGFDRIYLNVHWLSDVLGGVFFGIFWLLLCISVFSYFTTKYDSRIKAICKFLTRLD